MLLVCPPTNLHVGTQTPALQPLCTSAHTNAHTQRGGGHHSWHSPARLRTAAPAPHAPVPHSRWWAAAVPLPLPLPISSPRDVAPPNASSLQDAAAAPRSAGTQQQHRVSCSHDGHPGHTLPGQTPPATPQPHTQRRGRACVCVPVPTAQHWPHPGVMLPSAHRPLPPPQPPPQAAAARSSEAAPVSPRPGRR